ncbi:MAG: hypothetical protein QM601_02415 [Pseudoxanthomonas sp.]
MSDFYPFQFAHLVDAQNAIYKALGNPGPSRERKALNFARSAIVGATVFGKYDNRSADVIASERWGGEGAAVAKAATSAITGETTAEAEAFFGLAAEASLLGKLPLRRWPFRLRTLVSGGITAGEVIEGLATPMRVPSLSTFRLDARKFQGATIITREALERGGIIAETGLRNDLLQATADAVDAGFVADLLSAAGTFDGDHRFAVYLLNPADAAANADEKLNVRGGEYLGYPAFTSNAVDEGTAIFFDASKVAAAWETGEIDFSQHAAVEASDAPTGDSVTPTATQLVSLFQSNTVAIRATIIADWNISGAVEVTSVGS